MARVGDPVIRIAAAVLTLVDMQPLLPAPPLRSDRDALDLLRRQSGKLMLISTSRGMPSASTRRMMSGPIAQAGFPVRRMAAAPAIGLRQRERRNAEHGALDRAGNGAGIDHVLAGVAAAIDAGQDEIGPLAVEHDGARP